MEASSPLPESQSISCINCGNEITGSFCSSCGQRTLVKRMSFKEGWYDFWSRLYGFDGMFPRTLRDLTLRPGFVATEFIRGIRIKYYGPVGYFFLMVTLLLLLFSSLGLSFGEFVEETQKTLPVQQEQNFLSRWIIEFVSNNVKLVLFLGIPFQGIAARYFFFRKSGYRLIEHMVLPFYLTGHLLWSTITFVLLKTLFDVGIIGYAPIIAFAFYGLGYMTFSSKQPKVKSFFKGIGIYLAGQFLFMIFIVLVALSTIVYLKFFDPETFNLIRPGNQ